MRKLLIVGAGGFGREVRSYIEDDNPLFKFKGFLDDRSHILDLTQDEGLIVGSPLTHQPAADEVFMAALGEPRMRHHYTSILREKHGADFATVVHPMANTNRRASLGRGCIIAPRAGISVDVRIGDFTCIQEYTIIGHDVQIGNWCQINGHCTIAGKAIIGNFVTIHPNCVITADSVIEDGAIIAAGSVVYGRIKANMTVMGNPARRFQFKDDQR